MHIKAEDNAAATPLANPKVEGAAGLIDDHGDEELLDPAEVERAWIEEAERRYQEYLAGGVELIPAFEAIAEIRAALRSR